MAGDRDSDVPAGFTPLSDGGPFVDLVGPLYTDAVGAVGVRVESRHLNRAGTAMGGFLATLADVALGRAIRAVSGDDVATVSLTVDYLRPTRHGAWLEASTKVERLGGRLAFADCSVRGDGEELVRARAVFAVS